MTTSSGGNGQRVTIGELSRRFDRFENEWKGGFASIHRRLDELNFVDPDTLATKLLLEQAHRTDLERRVEKIESNNQWLWRTIGGILLTALLIGILYGAGVRH
jgi:hypothetical protein